MTSLAGSVIYIDANAFILFGEAHSDLGLRLKSVFAAMAEGTLEIVTSDLTLAEVLVGPLKSKRPDLVSAYEKLLFPRKNFFRIPVTVRILKRSAELRASFNIKLPDAIHVATALETACTVFLTEDHRLQVPVALVRKKISELPL